MSEITRMLNEVAAGDASSSEALLTAIYDELRMLASRKMAGEAPGHTLQPTALVHEAWLRLAQPQGQVWANRAHFFASAAEAMRRILVDNARRKRSEKRGGRHERLVLELEELEVATAASDDLILAVHEALDSLAAEDPQCAELVKLRFFAGFSNVEAAELLGMAERTAKRSWAYARARLFEELTGGSGSPAGPS